MAVAKWFWQRIVDILVYAAVLLACAFCVPIFVLFLIYGVRILYFKAIYKKHKIVERIFARKCEVREITDKNTVRDFLCHNHLQGVFLWAFVMFDFRRHRVFGLYHDDKLVFVGCFRPYKDDKTFMNYAFCSDCSVAVVGGTSKLISHFFKALPDKIMLTSSTKGAKAVYEKLNFREVRKMTLPDLILRRHQISRQRRGRFILWQMTNKAE